MLLLLVLLTPALGLAQDSREQDLAAFYTRLSEAATIGDSDGYAGLFWPTGTLFVPNHSPVIGRRAIRDWFVDFQESVALVVDTFEQEQIDIVGDIATVRSSATGAYVVRSTDERLNLEQKYLDVLRYSEGQWYMMYHVASNSLLEAGLWDRALSQSFGSDAGGGR